MTLLQSSKTSKFFLIFLATLGWFGLISQFYLNISGKTASLPELIIRFFSYFTILTNLLVAIACTILAYRPTSTVGSFFSRPATFTAIAMYILFVGIIYNLILRRLWSPRGLQLIVDNILHSIIPVLFLLFWLMVVPKSLLRWKDALPWVIYPVSYFLLSLLRGSLSGFYPYPFIDVSALGIHKVLLNGTVLVFAFLFISLLFIGIGKILPPKWKL